MTGQKTETNFAVPSVEANYGTSTEKSLEKLIDKLDVAVRSLTFGTSAAVRDGDTIPGIIPIVVVIPLIIPTYLRIKAHDS